MASPTQIYRIQRKRSFVRLVVTVGSCAKNGTTPSQKELFGDE